MPDCAPRQLREAALSARVMTWLRGRGFTPYAEVPLFFVGIDVLGVGDILVAVELKLFLSRAVIYTADLNQLGAHESWCAVSSKPRPAGLAECRQQGVGVLRVNEQGITVVLPASSPHPPIECYVKLLRERAAQTGEGGTGGLPCLLGKGPAQDCLARVREYRVTHAKATWQQVYAAVPNHYSNARTMACALRIIAIKVDKRQIRKEGRDNA